jgi:hypothetical protein
MTKDEALKLALEALEMCEVPWTGTLDHNLTEAITAIKQALAAPVQDNSNYRLDPPGLDPAYGTQVSKVWWDGDKLMAKPIPFVEFYKAAPAPGYCRQCKQYSIEEPLPAAQRQWVGLTDEEIEKLRESFATRYAIEAIEAKLKERNQ